jgi:hypothetical protein
MQREMTDSEGQIVNLFDPNLVVNHKLYFLKLSRNNIRGRKNPGMKLGTYSLAGEVEHIFSEGDQEALCFCSSRGVDRPAYYMIQKRKPNHGL